MFLGDFYEFSGAFFTDSIFTFPLIFRIIRTHSEMSSSFLLAYELPVDRRMLRIGAISERKQNGSLCFLKGVMSVWEVYLLYSFLPHGRIENGGKYIILKFY